MKDSTIHLRHDESVDGAKPVLQNPIAPSIMTLDSNEASNSGFVYSVAIIYLLVPSLIVLVYFGRWAVPVLLVSALAVFWWLKNGDRLSSRDLVPFYEAWPYLVISGLAVWLSGVIPPFGENLDWYKHYAMFNDLTSQSWPPNVTTNGEALATLRYSLSYYVIPAIVAKIAGSAVLYYAAFAWTTLGCYLALLLAFGLQRQTKAENFLLSSIFLLFSGADIIGSYVAKNLPLSPMPLLHFEWWASFGELPSSFTSLVWTPQHAIAGWIAAFLVLRFPVRSIRNAGAMGAAVALWSPFCAIGLIPTLTWALFQTGIRPVFSRSNLIVAPVLLLAAALYLTHGATGIPFRFVWDAPDVIWQKRGFSALVWVTFVVVEFGAIVAAIMLVTHRRWLLAGIHALFLFALCFPSVGETNDLLMRASIPSLGILALLAADAIVNTPRSVRKIPLVVCLVIGVITPAGEIMRALVSSRILKRFQLSTIDVVGGQKKLEPQYLVYETNEVPITKSDVLTTDSLRFETFGQATFDIVARQVSADTFVDAALVSNAIELPLGIYRLDAVLDWDVKSENAEENAAHVSLHAERLLAPIMTSRSVDGHISRYFTSFGKPFRISFGLGGWAQGKGFIRLKSLSIGLVKPIEK